MKKWLRLLLVVIVFAVISIVVFFICKALNLTNLNTIRGFIESTGKWGLVVFVLIELLIATVFCFVPVLDDALILLGVVIFGAKVGFFVSWAVIFVSSSILFFVGDKFGERLAVKLVGKKELSQAQDLLDTKSKIFLPIVFLIPCLPDDALCIVAGMTKMKYWYFAIVALIFRGIDTFIICFLGGAINWATITVVEWVIIANLIMIDAYLIYKLQKWVERRKK